MSNDAALQGTLQRVYSHVLNHDVGHGVSATELAAELVLPQPEAGASVETLLKMGLLCRRTGDRLVAVPPDQAATDVLGPQEREMRTQRARIERMRREYASFMPAFEASMTNQHRSRVQLLENLADVRAAITDLVTHCKEEILTAQPGGGREESVLEEAASRDEEALSRGVSMKILYQHTALFSRGTNVYIDLVTGLGAQVRTLDDHFMRMLIFDRKTALIAIPGNPQGAALIEEPNMVAFVVHTHERLWLAAEPLPVGTDTRAGITDSLKQMIIRLLTEGMTDASIATRLGMSVRTCRRHVAEIMAELEAQSRFQAGYLLAARELMDT
ncbi:LuxR C-terminal-related transcriptional regulator [Streptomyces sp. NPDC053086]|uniref:LuxR C-terminal-related transcriptional regulator n=1 Tax=unclassified Streptomyces TaxID=2593676 RepID=UPI0037D45E6B